MNNKLMLKHTCLTGVIAACFMIHSAQAAEEILIKEQPHQIYHVIQNKTLKQAANQIANRSGIKFKINAANQNDKVNKKLATDDWQTALSQLLAGYNYSTVYNQGKIVSVIITGENGSGKMPDSSIEVQPDTVANLPGKYKGLKPGSVMPLDLPLAQLNASAVGKKIMLDLPIGQYRVNHDDLIKHADGSSTWIGYLDDEGKGYRFYLSQGEVGLMGNLYTPDGAYNIESENGQTVLVDLDHSGLQSASVENDQVRVPANPFNLSGLPTNTGSGIKSAAALIGSSSTSSKTTALATTATTGPVIDIMVLYTTVKQTQTYAKQRAQYLADISNTAYRDSKVNMRVRLVHTRRTTYSESNSNSQALNDLTNDVGAFKGVAALRTTYGADAVFLMRPLYAKTAGGCGLTWVGFSNGSGANARYAYGTFGDGLSKDALTGYYCHASTFAHEFGHTLGNVHDREYSSFPGKFSYSYAWGIQGKFGTIMSYKSPTLMLFSTPLLPTQCYGVPCGYAEGKTNSSDQSRTINYTAPFVVNYKPKTITTPVIQ